MLTLLFAAALALDVPERAPGQRVYLVPPDLAFPTRDVSLAVGAAEHDVWVVVYEQVIDGRIEPGHASETEDAIERVWSEWAARGDDAFDPTEDNLVLLALDDREVRIHAGSAWDSRYGLWGEELGLIVDRHFLPKAAARDYDGALADLVAGLDAEITRRVEAARLAEDRAAARARTLRVAAPVGGAGCLGAAGMLGLWGATLPRRRARRGFERALAERRAALEAAEGELAGFRIDTELRDRLLELRLKGARTLRTFEEVTERIDAIQVGLAALRRHAEGCARRAAAAGALDAAALREEELALDAPFSSDIGEVPHRLFASGARRVELEPRAFMAELEAGYALARAGWQVLLDAVAASLRAARDDLSASDLDDRLEALDARGLGRALAADHPLVGDREAVWAGLDAQRVADPVAYLEALADAIDEADASEAALDEMIGAVDAATAARDAALAVAVPGDTVVESGADPAPAEDAARAADDALDATRSGGGQGAVLAAAAAATSAWNEVAARRTALRDAVDGAEAAIGEAVRAVDALDARLAAAWARSRALRADHSADAMLHVTTEEAEASRDIGEARAAIEAAREALSERRHLAAVRCAAQARTEHAEGVRNLEELVAAIDRLVREKAAFEEQVATVADIRRQHAQGLGRWGAEESALAPGDTLLAALRAEAARGGPADWAARTARLEAVLRAWQAPVAAARSSWEAEQARLRREREAAERVRAASRRASTPRSSGYASVSSARSSSSSTRTSSSSRSRSGGGSFSSGSRSGGSSFGGGGGRSGGRKF